MTARELLARLEADFKRSEITNPIPIPLKAKYRPGGRAYKAI